MDFDMKLARDCVDAFSLSSGLGCVLTDAEGAILYARGSSCAGCSLCALAHRDKDACRQTRKYGMGEAKRFGGSYIYFCTMGLTLLTSPFLGIRGGEAQLTAGPLRMMDVQDYTACELYEMPGIPQDTLFRLEKAVSQVSFVEAPRVTALSHLLFMTAAFMNSTAEQNRLLENQTSVRLQGRISDYIFHLKEHPSGAAAYPYATERRFLLALAEGDRAQAQKLLNELLGFILFSFGGDLNSIHGRIYELLVLICRTAAEVGEDPEPIYRQSQMFLADGPSIQSMEEMCLRLSRVVRGFMDAFLSDRKPHHTHLIHQVMQYLQIHCTEKITLEEISRSVYMSPSYLSRVFKQETGISVIHYLHHIRVEKSKELLLDPSLSLIDIAFQCGFTSQSYFTSVFKEKTGITPREYRKRNAMATS